MKRLEACEYCGSLPDYGWTHRTYQLEDDTEEVEAYFYIRCPRHCKEEYYNKANEVMQQSEEAAIEEWNTKNHTCPFYVDLLIEFANDIERHLESEHCTIDYAYAKRIRAKWRRLTRFMMEEWGYNEKAIKHLVSWGDGGHNWELLHWDMEEDPKKVINDFRGEVYYCSDRMSMDRYFRCQYLINQAVDILKQKEKPDDEYWGLNKPDKDYSPADDFKDAVHSLKNGVVSLKDKIQNTINSLTEK